MCRTVRELLGAVFQDLPLRAAEQRQHLRRRSIPPGGCPFATAMAFGLFFFLLLFSVVAVDSSI